MQAAISVPSSTFPSDLKWALSSGGFPCPFLAYVCVSPPHVYVCVCAIHAVPTWAGAFADVLFVVGDPAAPDARPPLYAVHRVVLCRNSFFRTLLAGGFKEAVADATGRRCVTIDDKDVTCAAFEVVLEWLYAGLVPTEPDALLVALTSASRSGPTCCAFASKAIPYPCVCVRVRVLVVVPLFRLIGLWFLTSSSRRSRSLRRTWMSPMLTGAWSLRRGGVALRVRVCGCVWVPLDSCPTLTRAHQARVSTPSSSLFGRAVDQVTMV